MTGLVMRSMFVFELTKTGLFNRIASFCARSDDSVFSMLVIDDDTG